MQRETAGAGAGGRAAGLGSGDVMPRGAAGQRAEEGRRRWRRCCTPAGPIRAWANGWPAEDARCPGARAAAPDPARPRARAAGARADLATALARLTSRAQGIWAAARAEDDFAAFAPVLAEVVRLKREEARRWPTAATSMMRCWTISSRARAAEIARPASSACGQGWWPCANPVLTVPMSIRNCAASSTRRGRWRCAAACRGVRL